jgi:hypothetical protein
MISWSSKQQPTVSRSSAEAEFWAIANVVAKTTWLPHLLGELHSLIRHGTLVYCDNVSAIYLMADLVQHQRMKHIEIDLHFICDKVTAGAVCVLHVPNNSQYADILKVHLGPHVDFGGLMTDN